MTLILSFLIFRVRLGVSECFPSQEDRQRLLGGLLLFYHPLCLKSGWKRAFYVPSISLESPVAVCPPIR